jgi:hypothetical protein
MDYQNLYETNNNFKNYVDRYCRKHEKSVKEALLDVLVRAYGSQVEEREREVVKPVVTEINVGCGGC